MFFVGISDKSYGSLLHEAYILVVGKERYSAVKTITGVMISNVSILARK